MCRSPLRLRHKERGRSRGRVHITYLQLCNKGLQLRLLVLELSVDLLHHLADLLQGAALDLVHLGGALGDIHDGFLGVAVPLRCGAPWCGKGS
jgi:hypothetical protein